MSDHMLAIAGIVLGLIAIGVAVQGFFQMNWGHPKIKIGFDESHEDGRTAWLGTVENVPVGRWLKKIGVRREPVKIGVTFQIYRSNGDLVVQRIFVLLKADSGERAQQILLYPPIPIPFTIAACQKDSATVYAVNIKQNTSTPLPAGQYKVDVDVMAEDVLHSASSTFIVGPTASKTHWS
jgi:hypothetical protein